MRQSSSDPANYVRNRLMFRKRTQTEAADKQTQRRRRKARDGDVKRDRRSQPGIK